MYRTIQRPVEDVLTQLPKQMLVPTLVSLYLKSHAPAHPMLTGYCAKFQLYDAKFESWFLAWHTHQLKPQAYSEPFDAYDQTAQRSAGIYSATVECPMQSVGAYNPPDCKATGTLTRLAGSFRIKNLNCCRWEIARRQALALQNVAQFLWPDSLCPSLVVPGETKNMSNERNEREPA
ncbi:hypothetical protein FRC12_003067 [Ceratobasidium sp. 428]|nr:hypothetical protein FRC12_003067 [Ceratobasidium sp. 428]